MRAPGAGRLVVTLFLALPAAAAGVSGAWNFKTLTAEGEDRATMTLAQDGEKLTGHFESPRGKYPLEGTVKGEQIEFTVKYSGGDLTIQVAFRGAVEGERMKGEFKAGDFTGAWSAERAR